MSEPVWTKEPPSQSGLYWWWNGDKDCAPIPLNVAFSGHSNSFFVMGGQYGLKYAENVCEKKGWWKPLPEPSLP